MEMHLFSQNGLSIKCKAQFHWLVLRGPLALHRRFWVTFRRDTVHIGKYWGRGSFSLPFLLLCNSLVRSSCWLLFFFLSCKSGDRSAGGRWTSDRFRGSLAPSKNVSKPEAASQLFHADCEAGIVGRPALLKLWLMRMTNWRGDENKGLLTPAQHRANSALLCVFMALCACWLAVFLG